MLNLCGIVAAILKMATGRNVSMSGINSGHHNLPTYQMLMISDNVEFLPPFFSCRVLAAILKILKTQNCSYHCVKIYVSIINHLEVININV